MKEEERGRGGEEGKGLTACSNKGESATCIPAAHNALLSCSHASLPFSHCPARSLFPPRASPFPPYETLIFFLLPTHTAQVYIRPECLVARCTEGEKHRFFFAAAPRVFRSIAQSARFSLLDGSLLREVIRGYPFFLLAFLGMGDGAREELSCSAKSRAKSITRGLFFGFE